MFSIIFPGQGTQFVGMGKEFYEKYSLVKDIFFKADEVLNYKLSILLKIHSQQYLLLVTQFFQ